MGNEVAEGTTTGIWIGEGDGERFEAFDRYFRRLDGEYSRSERLKTAMDVYRVVHEEFMDDEGLPHPDEMRLQEFLASIRSEIRLDDTEKTVE